MPDAQIPCGCVCQSLPESSTLPLSTLPSPLPSVSHHQDEITNHHKSGRNPHAHTHAPLHHKSARNPHAHIHAPLQHITRARATPRAHTHRCDTSQTITRVRATPKRIHTRRCITRARATPVRIYTHRCNTSQERAQPPCAHMHCCDTHHASQERAQPPRKRPVFSSRRSRSGRAGVPCSGLPKNCTKAP